MATKERQRLIFNANQRVGTIVIGGNPKHSTKEQEELKKLLKVALQKAGLGGDPTLSATTVQVKGKPHTKGLSVGTIEPMGVSLFYQPGGNDTRFKYYLCLPHNNQVGDDNYRENIATALNNVCGVGFTGGTKSKPPEVTKHKVEPVSEPKVVAPSPATVSPTSVVKPSNGYLHDETWRTAFLGKLKQCSQAVGRYLTKDEVLKELIANTHYEQVFGAAGRLYGHLVGHGWLVVTKAGIKVVTENPVRVKDHYGPKKKLVRKDNQRSDAGSEAIPAHKAGVVSSVPNVTAKKFVASPEMIDAFMSTFKTSMIANTDLLQKLQKQFPTWSEGKCYAVIAGLVDKAVLFRHRKGVYQIPERYLVKPTTHTPPKKEGLDLVGVSKVVQKPAERADVSSQTRNTVEFEELRKQVELLVQIGESLEAEKEALEKRATEAEAEVVALKGQLAAAEPPEELLEEIQGLVAVVKQLGEERNTLQSVNTDQAAKISSLEAQLAARQPSEKTKQLMSEVRTVIDRYSGH